MFRQCTDKIQPHTKEMFQLKYHCQFAFNIEYCFKWFKHMMSYAILGKVLKLRTNHIILYLLTQEYPFLFGFMHDIYLIPNEVLLKNSTISINWSVSTYLIVCCFRGFLYKCQILYIDSLTPLECTTQLLLRLMIFRWIEWGRWASNIFPW